MTTEQIKELDEIQKYLEISCSNDPAEIQERITTIMVYLARTGELLATAKRELRRKKSSEISNTIIEIAKQQCLSRNVQNSLLESIAEEESFIVDRIDRLNSTCVHQVDGLRSLLSYAKEEMRISNYG